MPEIKNILAKYIPDVEHTIKDYLSEAPPFIGGVIRYHFGWADQNFEPEKSESGKMLRPVLCLLVMDALTGNYKKVLPAAAAIEMIHNFTLLHDDIEDGDLERRGRPTAWAIWGNPLAINVGDYLYTLAFKSLFRLDNAHFSFKKIFLVQQLIADSCLILTTGQDLDLRFEQSQDVTAGMYLDMVYRKTGALLEASILTGAILGTSDPQLIKNYRGFARNIGIAFQIRDDILGIWGDAAKTGKSVDNDLRRKKKTLPIIYMLNKATGDRRKKLLALYADNALLTASEISFVRQSLAWVEAHTYAQQSADRYIQDAFGALKRIDISNQPQAELETIARFLIDRSH